ncbi:ATP-binding protein [Nitratidesulfovibrio termitidis]|uniref:ATP-binding protein n=1 Tax=Nitratidesulfovibrio termitidis TaxID=42252 RepID=UPI0004212742|nr:DUF87 domain-containing protein [Nitratidesulfovibrio termitidis]
MSISKQLSQTNIFRRKENEGKLFWDTGEFVGRPFRLSYAHVEILVADAWKQNAGGIPQGCFLIAYYDNEPKDDTSLEAILLRVLSPTTLPTDPDVVSSLVEYYKEGIETGETKRSQLDTFTRYEFSFSGLKCAILGCFYKDEHKNTRFGADLENFYSSHNYSVIKPSPDILKYIVNYRQFGTPGSISDIRVGKVRYSSSLRFQGKEPEVPVYAQAQDFAGKRTAMFGMTRTGKSNTVKKIIQANVEMSLHSSLILDQYRESTDEVLKPFTDTGTPKYPIGQIIFDINGEYANPNLQDQGTAIFDLYKDTTVRYSTVKKNGFKEMKVNFYNELEAGFNLICSHPSIAEDSSRFATNFRNVVLDKPEDYNENKSAKNRYDRKLAVYYSCLYRAGFTPPSDFKVSFVANRDIRTVVSTNTDPKNGLTLEESAEWWDSLWTVYEDADVFSDYKKKKQKEWADDDLKALLTILTRKRSPGGRTDCSGFRILKEIIPQHTSTNQKPFDTDILAQLRAGNIVIVDLSLGDDDIQRMFTERITRHIFRDAMNRFTSTLPNNFIQFYFEEAHNLFPKKEDKDLSQIYNRLAKEGAKLNLGLVYATQEVSSISSNILKATQNWFISHLNNEDEIRELRKYYDFSDFTESLIRFSQDTDKGFVRMKTYSNAFVVPVQVDRFPPENAPRT